MKSKYSRACLLAGLMYSCFSNVLARSGAAVRDAVARSMGGVRVLAAWRIEGTSW